MQRAHPNQLISRSMLAPSEVVLPDTPEWHDFYERLQKSTTLASLVLTAWQIGLWFAKTLVEQQLNQRAQRPQSWENCNQCGTRLQSKGFVSRRMLTLVGWVEWKRRVGRCPRHCLSIGATPFDQVLEIRPYQQTSVELMRLGCLLAVFLPFEWRCKYWFNCVVFESVMTRFGNGFKALGNRRCSG